MMPIVTPGGGYQPRLTNVEPTLGAGWGGNGVVPVEPVRAALEVDDRGDAGGSRDDGTDRAPSQACAPARRGVAEERDRDENAEGERHEREQELAAEVAREREQEREAGEQADDEVLGERHARRA